MRPGSCTDAARRRWPRPGAGWGGWGRLAEVGGGMDALSTSIDASRVELLGGDIEAAERELRRDDEALAAIDERYFRSTVAGILANVLADRGDLEGSVRYATLAEEISDADDSWSQVAWRTARAKVLAAGGDGHGAVTLAERAVSLASETEDESLRADAL